jgi:sarcosine oxidase
MVTYDAVVCGLGVTGSAALHALASRGLRVLGLERFSPGHDRGSSHGATRIIRLSYFEHPSYVPLLHRAYQLWRELERAAARRVLHVTGIIEIGPPDGGLVPGTLAAARLHLLRHEALTAAEVMRRFPAFRLPPHYVGAFQSDGGYLDAEPAIEIFLALAQAAGAHVRTGESIKAIETRGSGVRVITDRGAVDAGCVIVCVGPWTKALLPDLAVSLRVTRQVMGWFAPSRPELFSPGSFPVFLIESRHGIHYGFPAIGDGGVKVARHHHQDETVDSENYDRTVSAEDERLIRSAVVEYLPAANGPLIAAKTCLYTMMPDGDFLIDHMPDAPQVIVASPCSGHGFKFAPVVGEILADLAIAGTTSHDIARFRLERG